MTIFFPLQGPKERNYHVFYQLLAGARKNRDLAEQFQIMTERKYVYLNQSGCSEIEGMDDALQFDALRLAFNVLHVPQETSDGAFAL